LCVFGILQLLESRNLRFSELVFTELVLEAAQQVMWLGVSFIERHRLFKRLSRSVVLALHLQDPSKLIVRLWKLAIVTNGFSQALFRLRQSIYGH
jgi:hypothetical protein